MPWLALAKRQNGETLASKTLVSESKQTAVCAYLSGAVLVGLGLNAFAGLWWADSVAALVVAAVAAREGIEAWRGELLTEQGCCG
jgi:divalent metal cation (Fe/Co/Zn/Cd) transporter